MKRVAVFFGLLVSILFVGFVVSGCGSDNPLEINSVVLDKASYNEGDTATITVQVQRSGTGGGGLISAEAAGALLMPGTFRVVGDSWTVNSYSNVGGVFTGTANLKRVTSGVVMDGFEIMKRKLYVLRPELASLEASGYTWFVGQGDQRSVLGNGDYMNVIVTIEACKAGPVQMVYICGITPSVCDPANWRGTCKAHVIDVSTDRVIGSGFVGLAAGAISLGTGGLSMGDSGKIFVLGGDNVSPIDPAHRIGYVLASHSITIIDSNTGGHLRTIALPLEFPSGGGDWGYTVKSIVNVGGRLYAGHNGSSGSIRIYEESGDLASPTDYVDLIPAGGLSSQPAGLAATVEGGVNKVYAVTEFPYCLLVLTDDKINPPTYETIALPSSSTWQHLWLLSDGGVAITGNNKVLMINASMEIEAELTPEANPPDAAPNYAVDDPINKKLYIAQSINSPIFPSKIWAVYYGGDDTPTFEVLTVGDGSLHNMGRFTVDGEHNKIFIPIFSVSGSGNGDGALIVLDPATKYQNSVEINGVPMSVLYVNGKVYISDVGHWDPSSGGGYNIGNPPESYGYQVRVMPWNGTGITHSIDVGYLPGAMAYKNGKLVVVSFGVPAAFTDIYIGTDEVVSVSTPEVQTVLINGGSVTNNDYISSNPVLTAHLTDANGSVWDAKVYLDGVEVPATFNPPLPANDVSNLSINLGALSSTGTHSITIEVTDGAQVVTWEVFGLKAAPQGAPLVMKAGYPSVYPSVFKPLSGSSSEKTLRIAYDLSIDSPISVMIVDLSGKPVFTRKYSSGTMGGRAGYNEVLWNGRMDTGGVVGNGIYPYKIVSGSKMLAKGKIVVYD